MACRCTSTAGRYFYPRPPRGGRRPGGNHAAGRENFYPRPPRGGRREISWWDHVTDTFLSTPSARRATISRAPMWLPPIFLSTPSARRATSYTAESSIIDVGFLSTPSARRATTQWFPLVTSMPISIHALREEGDRPASRPWSRSARFLSTPSARRATCPSGSYAHKHDISIHALREEGDVCPCCGAKLEPQFLSTPSARRATV